MLKVDKQSLTILKLLQGDASLSIATLAEHVGVSKSACWRRMQHLTDCGVITDRVTLLNQQALNLQLTVYISVRTKQYNEDWAQSFQRMVAEIPELIEVHRMTGDKDYLLKAVVPDMPGYTQLFKVLSKAGLIDISSSFVMETMKQTTELPLRYIQPA